MFFNDTPSFLLLLFIYFSLHWTLAIAIEGTTTASSDFVDDNPPDPGMALEGKCVVVCDTSLPETIQRDTDDRLRKKPKRLAFSVMQMGTDAPVDIVFDYLLLNVGNAYDMSKGIFTASVPGVYSFHFTIFKVLNNRQLTVSLTVNGIPVLFGFAYSAVAPHDMAHNSGLVKLNEKDRVQLRIEEGSLRGGWQYSTFSGYLLYDDDGF